MLLNCSNMYGICITNRLAKRKKNNTRKTLKTLTSQLSTQVNFISHVSTQVNLFYFIFFIYLKITHLSQTRLYSKNLNSKKLLDSFTAFLYNILRRLHVASIIYIVITYLYIIYVIYIIRS